jgi:hypothetical protein
MKTAEQNAQKDVQPKQMNISIKIKNINYVLTDIKKRPFRHFFI